MEDIEKEILALDNYKASQEIDTLTKLLKENVNTVSYVLYTKLL